MKDLSRLDLYDYLTVPWKRRWYFLSAMILVLIGATVLAWMRPNLYRSETRILVKSATLLDDPLSPDSVRDRTEERMGAMRQLLESRTILETIVEEFRLRPADGTLMEDQVKSIRGSLEISKAAGNIFTMAYVGDSPQNAQLITRRLAEILIRKNQEAQKYMAEGKDEFMEGELVQARKDLAAIDLKLKDFKESHLGALPEQSTANMNALSGLRNQLTAVDVALDRFRDQQKSLEFRVQEQRRIGELAKSLNTPGEKSGTPERATQSPIAAVINAKRAQLTEALSKFTPRHPDVIRLNKEIADLERQETESGGLENPLSEPTSPRSGNPQNSQIELTTEAEIAQAKYELEILAKTIARKDKERADLTRQIEMCQDRLNLAPKLEQELLGLMRDRDAKQQQVEILGTRKFNAQMAANATSKKQNDTYEVLDEASLPERPVFPTRIHIILIGILGSLASGFAAALGRELFESSMSNEDEVIALLKIPVLANIPEIPVK